MADYQTILYEKQRGGVLITLNRPERLNGLSPELLGELHAALGQADEDPEIRAIVLTGAGRAFSSGIDVADPRGMQHPDQWPSGLPTGVSMAEYLDRTRKGMARSIDRLLELWELGTPVIAAVHGWCVGAASWYAMACHMTFACEHAVFGQPEIRDGGSTSFFWTLAAGYKRALRYSLTGDHIDATEANRIGIVTDVVPHDQLLETCFDIVERISHVPPQTVKLNLQMTTLGLEAGGLRTTLQMARELLAMASARRQEYYKPLDDTLRAKGLREFLALRDGPFQPEPFGPRAKDPRHPRP